jgi:hypothetical protein
MLAERIRAHAGHRRQDPSRRSSPPSPRSARNAWTPSTRRSCVCVGFSDGERQALYAEASRHGVDGSDPLFALSAKLRGAPRGFARSLFQRHPRVAALLGADFADFRFRRDCSRPLRRPAPRARPYRFLTATRTRAPRRASFSPGRDSARCVEGGLLATSTRRWVGGVSPSATGRVLCRVGRIYGASAVVRRRRRGLRQGQRRSATRSGRRFARGDRSSLSLSGAPPHRRRGPRRALASTSGCLSFLGRRSPETCRRRALHPPCPTRCASAASSCSAASDGC